MFSTLLSQGRSLASTLAQRCQLPLRHVQHGLAVMIQLRLVFHLTSHDGRTSYEANAKNAYDLARSGKAIAYVRKRHGEVAASIVSYLVTLGHASVLHLKNASRSHGLSSRSLVKGASAITSPLGCDSPDISQSEQEIEDVLRLLCEHGLVCRLRESHFRTDADNRQIAKDTVGNDSLLSTAKGTKLKEEIEVRVSMAMEMQGDTSIELRKVGPNGAGTQKRRADVTEESTPSAKRTKLANGTATTPERKRSSSLADHYSTWFDDNLVVKLSQATFARVFRNRSLSGLVAETYGDDVAQTYGAILEQLEPCSSYIRNDTYLHLGNDTTSKISTEVDLHRLARHLARSPPLSEGQSSPNLGAHDYVNGCAEQLSWEASAHLELLCEAPFRFLRHSLEHPDRYVIEHAGTSAQLRHTEIIRIISSRFDKYAVRIVQVLLDRGKSDEKSLQEIVLMSSKELRQTLSSLHQGGFVEVQEVPREAQHQPNRTIYLWFYDPDRVRMMLIEDNYKSMARCMQRMKLERERVKPTIEKSERSDIKDKEKAILSKAELKVLRAWRWKEEWILGELARLDHLVYVLRDF